MPGCRAELSHWSSERALELVFQVIIVLVAAFDGDFPDCHGCGRQQVPHRVEPPFAKGLLHRFPCYFPESQVEKAAGDAHMLRKSKLSIGRLAEECGFSNAKYAKAVFKKRFGMTMREWRRRNQS